VVCLAYHLEIWLNLVVDEAAIAARFKLFELCVDERARRLFAATEAMTIGRGGIVIVSRATGMSRRSIAEGIAELKEAQNGTVVNTSRVRRPGGGRKKATETDPKLKDDLEQLVEPMSRGDPQSPLRWTCKSNRVLADELKTMGHTVSHVTVASVLDDLKYSLQGNQKTLEGSSHPDRNAQFEHINATAKEYMAAGEPVISVDTKKKELIGPFKNAGREWQAKGQPEKVMVHDFPIEDQRAIPYGVYDQSRNEGWVTVGTDHDTASFAVQTIRRWWYNMGKERYPNADRLLITADGGGSNGSRVRLWKLELQDLADELGIPISVCHFPPGTSKWNKIEHRLFSFISQNWRGKPLVTHEVVVQLIQATKTKTGLKVRSALDTAKYPIGRRVSEEEFATINIQRYDFHGEWNYTISPRWRS
jgi:hypothetical protein